MVQYEGRCKKDRTARMLKQRMVQYKDRRKKNRTARTATDWTHGPQHMQTRAHEYLCVCTAGHLRMSISVICVLHF